MKRYAYDSASNGPLPEGCKHCANGSKMVLLITGKCNTGCFYCPISPEKKDKDVMYANERRIYDLSEMLDEARAMDATGTGITGGDPLTVMDRTKDAILMLRENFGDKHHIHLYTSMIDPEKIGALWEAGLNEIRFHPPLSQWTNMDVSGIQRITSDTTLDVGIEVPAIPGKKEELEKLILSVAETDIDFINLNEFEFSETNWNMMEEMGYSVKHDLSSAVYGSEKIALELMKEYPDFPIHFCSSAFKDGVQLRERLKRRASVNAKPYDLITEDGTVVKGVIYHDDLDEVADALRKLRFKEDMFTLDRDLGRAETGHRKLEKVSKKLPYDSFIVEEYPTYDRLEVERIPLKRKK